VIGGLWPEACVRPIAADGREVEADLAVAEIPGVMQIVDDVSFLTNGHSYLILVRNDIRTQASRAEAKVEWIRWIVDDCPRSHTLAGVPLFEISSGELVPFRRLKGGADLHEKEIETLVWANLEEFTGETCFRSYGRRSSRRVGSPTFSLSTSRAGSSSSR
jgi:hypothetical protein